MMASIQAAGYAVTEVSNLIVLTIIYLGLKP